MAGKSAIPTMVTTVLGLLNVTAINTTLGCAVYDEVPRNASFPYIALQSPQELRDDRMSVAGKQVFLEAHIFTSNESDLGSEKVSKIASKVCELTDYPTIAPTSDFKCWALRSDGVIDVGDEVDDGRTVKHYVVTITAFFDPV